MKKVTELSRAQLRELKKAFMIELVNDESYAGFFGVDHNEPSWGELANADSMVSDETIYNHYAGTSFTEDDLCGAR